MEDACRNDSSEPVMASDNEHRLTSSIDASRESLKEHREQQQVEPSSLLLSSSSSKPTHLPTLDVTISNETTTSTSTTTAAAASTNGAASTTVVTATSTSGITSGSRQDDRDGSSTYSLRVKPEYVLQDRDPSLPPLTAQQQEKDNNNNNRNGRGGGGGGGERGGGGAKKKRARTQAAGSNSSSDHLQLCNSVVRGIPCPYGDSCKYPHDLGAYMKERPMDVQVENLACPLYSCYGHCPFGVACRLGSQHITKAGVNMSKDTVTEPPATLNQLPRDVQDQLRKKKYPFVCQRYSQKKENGNPKKKKQQEQETSEETTQGTTATQTVVDFSPLPAKEVKLVDFSNKVYVAPLTTVGNLPFRRILKKFGVDITCGEMALCSNLLEGKPSEWALLKRHASEDVFGIQLAAGYPDMFTRTCELVQNHCQVDFVDMNLGCPLDIICNKGSGACLMLRDKRLEDSVRGMTATLGTPVTIKMRTGWDLDHPVAHKLVRKISSWGFNNNIAAVMIHGRSRLQRYSKLADWDYIHNQVAAAAGTATEAAVDAAEEQQQQLQDSQQRMIPVIGNGDIFSYVDYEQKVLAHHESSGLSTCAMLARGALIKPWLATEIKERRHWDIAATERLDILKDFVNYGLEHWGSDQKGVDNVRRFLLEWLSFLHRYVPVGLLEVVPQEMNHRAPLHMKGRNDLETLFLSPHSADWIRISEMLLGPVPEGFRFEPKHKTSG